MNEKSTLLDVFRNISANISQILQQARADVQGDIDGFVSNHIGKFFKIVGVYRDSFEKLGVKTKAEFERKASQYFRDREIQEEFDELLEKESEWDAFLQGVDTSMSSADKHVLKEGDIGPLTENVNEITAAGGKVLIVSFGVQVGAKKWLEETGCTFNMVLDTERKIYQAFGLKRSVLKVWSISCMVYYTEQLLAGRELPKPYENVHDDPQQMGGDFIVDSSGVIRLSYCSQTSTDRPTVDHLLSVMKSKSAETTD